MELVVPAAPEAVYAVVSDVTTVGSRSDECVAAQWLPGGPQSAAVGARFRGRNRSGIARWTRTCEVLEADPGRAFAFCTVPERVDPTRRDSTTWRYDLEPVEGGTLVRHSYAITQQPLAPLRALYGALLPQHKDMRPSMQLTLERLRDALVSSPDGAPTGAVRPD